MSRATSSVSIGRPIDDVFRVLTNVENTGKWFPGDVEEQWTSPPPHGLGSTRHAVVIMFGRRTENDAITTEFEPPHRAAMRGTSPNAPFEVALQFAPEAAGTRVDVTTDIKLQGVGRIIEPIVTAIYGWAWGRGLRKLKRLMESKSL